MIVRARSERVPERGYLLLESKNKVFLRCGETSPSKISVPSIGKGDETASKLESHSFRFQLASFRHRHGRHFSWSPAGGFWTSTPSRAGCLGEKNKNTHTHTLYENKGGVHQTFSVRGGQPTTPACRLHHPLLSCWPTLSVPAGVKEEPLTPVEEAPQCSKHPDAESARPA